MSKRIVKKKDVASTAKNGTPAPPTDARVAQQMRVLEVVGANKGSEKQDQKYSPRTENHIKGLLPVLDFFEYTRNDIANLVRRCHYDEQQIEITVNNIVEDRQNHESSQWGEVKSKKQLKEEKKIKEEEEKREQDRVERELEKVRKDAEKKAARELAGRAAAAASRHGGKMSYNDHGDYGADGAVTNPATLPPDPAIIFAGAKPGSCETVGSGGGKDEWWDGFAQNWATADWDNNKDDSGAVANGADKNWESGNDWGWKQGHWEEDDWGDGGGDSNGGKGEEAWWDGDWQKASGGRGKKGPKETRGGGGSKKEPKDLADMWDMPDTAADPNSGSLDQWTLGDIRAHEERRVAGASSDGATDTPLPLLPKMPPESRTVEELEREQLGAGLPPPGRPPPSAPPPGGKSPIDMLLQEAGGAANAAGAAVASDRPEKPSGKGKGKSKEGRGDRGGKGDRGDRPERGDRGDRGDRSERGERSERPPRREREAEPDGDDRGDKGAIERLDRSDDPRRQAIEEAGEFVTVRKHSSMGCAVVSMSEPRVREAVLAALGGEVTISNTRVQLKPHHDKETHKEVLTDIFAAWGRQAEKNAPLPEREIMKFFEAKHMEFIESCRAEEEKARLADERARQQKLLEEQQRQQEEQRAREEEKRKFELDLMRRRQEEDQQRQEAQRKQLEDHQKRLQEEQRIHHEKQAKWINDLQGNWAAQHAGGMPGHTGAGAHDPRRAAASLGAGAMNSVAAAAGAATTASTAQTRADQMSASAAGLNAQAAAYPNPQGSVQAAAAQQWQAAQWMQAMYTAQQQQQGWQQQMAHAQAAQQQRGMAGQQMNGMGGMPSQQDYEQQLRAHAAYYAQMADMQHRTQSAAYAQQQQGGYTMNGGQQASTFGYGAAAYGRGERI